MHSTQKYLIAAWREQRANAGENRTESLILTAREAQVVARAMDSLRQVGTVAGDLAIQPERNRERVVVLWNEEGVAVARGFSRRELNNDLESFAAAYGLTVAFGPNATITDGSALPDDRKPALVP